MPGLGYVDGFPSERIGMPVRGFKGHVMCSTRVREHDSGPLGYELSFPAIGGLSGAPLIITKGDKRFNTGYIIGNRTAQYHGDDQKFHSALAISASAFLSEKSEILGCTFSEFLAKNKLL